MPEALATIYLAVNKINGKKYVGKTARAFDVRHREHIYDARNKFKRAFSRAIRKYGIEAFEFTVLEECERAAIDERERHWIKHHECRSPKGYNLTDGGDGTLGTSRPDVTARLKAMTGEKNHMHGRIFTAEERKRFGQPGAKNARFGVKLSDQFKGLLSERVRAAMQTPEIRQRFLDGLERFRSSPEFEQKKAATVERQKVYKHIVKIEEKARRLGPRILRRHLRVVLDGYRREHRGEIMKEAFSGPDIRAARARRATGRKHSQETKAKQSENMKNIWKQRREVAA